MLSPLVLLPTAALPQWYIDHRIHAHTRLAIDSNVGCNQQTNGTWTCSDIFSNAGAAFASLGVPAYVRHTHTANEGIWWPSATDPFDAWHPLVQATNRSLPQEFLAEAAATRTKVIFYHYMKTNEFYSTKYPKWAAQWPNGSHIRWQRGIGLSPCDDQWTSTYIAQVEQLVRFGADAFYFDEYPTSWGGDWSAACRRRFKAAYGDDMPTELIDQSGQVCEGRGLCQPVAKDKRVLDLMRKVTEEYFANLTAAVARAAGPSGRVVSLVSTFLAPTPIDGWTASSGGGVFETTRLLDSPSDTIAAKTELRKGSRFSVSAQQVEGDPFDELELDSFGYVLMRDGATRAADGSMAAPHIWIPGIKRSDVMACASAAVVAHGCVANPDHAESGLPNASLFNATYALAAKLSKAWASAPGLRPAKYASVLFSESARNAWLPDNARNAWQRILFPALGAWRALLRAALPATLLVDWQLLSQPAELTAREHPMLIAPPDDDLPYDLVAALKAYGAAGGRLVRASVADGWNATSARPAAEAKLVSALQAAAAAPPRVSLSPNAAASGVQLHSYEAQDAMLVFALNNFTGCFGGGSIPRPVSGLALAGAGAKPRSAVDVVSGNVLDVESTGAAGWRVALPDVATVVGVALAF